MRLELIQKVGDLQQFLFPSLRSLAAIASGNTNRHLTMRYYSAQNRLGVDSHNYSIEGQRVVCSCLIMLAIDIL